ncbi:hypothetical protein ACKLNO_07895 [Neisseriaceae bacterium B1]
MHDFRHEILHNQDFSAAYDADAKAVLRQVGRDLRDKRTQVVWAVLQPIKTVQREQLQSRVTLGAIVGCVLGCAAWWAVDKYVLHEQISRETPMLFYGAFVVFVAMFVLQLFMLKNLAKVADKPRHAVTYVHLDLLAQTVTQIAQAGRYPMIYSFHGKGLARKMAKLPAFRLPETEQAEYAALRARVQNEITALCGLPFADDK